MPDSRIVSVVAGGWSVRNVDTAKIPGIVIAVNDSALLLPKIDAIVSMDRLWAEYRFPFLVEKRRKTYLRRSAVQNLPLKPADDEWLRVFECNHTSVEFSDCSDRLNGTSSGTCALNLAHLLRPERLFLFGFDMNRDPDGAAHWFEPYPWTKPEGATSAGKYREWAAQFRSIAQQFETIGTTVLNVSPSSGIETFKKISPNDIERFAS